MLQVGADLSNEKLHTLRSEWRVLQQHPLGQFNNGRTAEEAAAGHSLSTQTQRMCHVRASGNMHVRMLCRLSDEPDRFSWAPRKHDSTVPQRFLISSRFPYYTVTEQLKWDEKTRMWIDFAC